MALAGVVGDEANHPGIPKLRRRLAAAAQAARTLRRELEDAMMLSLFLGEDRVWAVDENRTMRELNDIEARAERASSDLPKGKGPHKGFQRLAAETICALIVSVAWKEVRSEAAPKASLDVHAACEDLWDAVGGDTAPRGGSQQEPDGMWRSHLRQADKFRDSLYANIIRDRLKM
jgi:hypothetical protein